jgi:hypothetical protein
MNGLKNPTLKAFTCFLEVLTRWLEIQRQTSFHCDLPYLHRNSVGSFKRRASSILAIDHERAARERKPKIFRQVYNASAIRAWRINFHFEHIIVCVSPRHTNASSGGGMSPRSPIQAQCLRRNNPAGKSRPRSADSKYILRKRRSRCSGPAMTERSGDTQTRSSIRIQDFPKRAGIVDVASICHLGPKREQ